MSLRIWNFRIVVAAAALFHHAPPAGCSSAHNVASVDSTGSRIVREIPFSLERNRTVLPLVVSEAETLDILLDTGMTWDGVYLFHKDAQRHFPGDDLDSVRVGGSGSGEPTYALMADSMTLRFGDVTFGSQLVVISQSEITQGFPSDGVTGSSLFGAFAVEVDNDAKELRLHDPESFVADSSWAAVPIILKEGIPFLDGEVSISGEDPVPLVLYIDSGTGEALELLERDAMKFPLPESLDVYHVGTGLSGDVHGRRGRISLLGLGGFQLHDVPAAFVPAKIRSKREGADGIIGNDALRRFNVVFDYHHGFLYLRPSTLLGVPFGVGAARR